MKNSAQTSSENFRHQQTTVHLRSGRDTLIDKNSSVVSVDHHLNLSTSNETLDQIRRALKSSSTIRTIDDHHLSTENARYCSLTQMLLLYADENTDTLTNLYHNLNNVLNILELHFNVYADDKQQIYFEDIFQILHNFKEQTTELTLIQTMEFLQVLI